MFLRGAGLGARVLNGFPLMHTTAVYQRASGRPNPNKRVFILTRSAYAGQQRNGSGDLVRRYHGDLGRLRPSDPRPPQLLPAGIPYWTTDIGAFFENYPGGFV